MLLDLRAHTSFWNAPWNLSLDAPSITMMFPGITTPSFILIHQLSNSSIRISGAGHTSWWHPLTTLSTLVCPPNGMENHQCGLFYKALQWHHMSIMGHKLLNKQPRCWWIEMPWASEIINNSIVCSTISSKEMSKFCITGPLWGESTSTWMFPSHRNNYAKWMCVHTIMPSWRK